MSPHAALRTIKPSIAYAHRAMMAAPPGYASYPRSAAAHTFSNAVTAATRATAEPIAHFRERVIRHLPVLFARCCGPPLLRSPALHPGSEDAEYDRKRQRTRSPGRLLPRDQQEQQRCDQPQAPHPPATVDLFCHFWSGCSPARAFLSIFATTCTRGSTTSAIWYCIAVPRTTATSFGVSL